MPDNFHLKVTFLDAAFHGRGGAGKPEWPPSPLRVFQALVAAAASRWREPQFSDQAVPALEWLERLAPPDVVAPVGKPTSSAYRLYVPNNAADLVAVAWARGNPEASIAEHRVEKDVRPTRLVGGDCVHYHWDLPETMPPHVAGFLETLAAAARSITHLGWGIDMVAANAAVISEADADKLPGERWRSVEDASANGYRVPIPGTLAALMQKHQAFLNRIERDAQGNESFNPVPPLSAFRVRVVGYRRATDVPGRPHVAFKLLHPEFERLAWFSTTRANCVAAMTRHATANAAHQQPQGWVDSYVHGHRSTGEDTKPRFSYLPLPTIEHRREGGRVVGGIRHVLLAELTEVSTSHLTWARQMVAGQFLIDENGGERKAMLAPLNDSDWVLRQYTDASATWATVTPVVLPGSDDGKLAKAEKLFMKSLRHAGYSPDALAEEPAFRNVSFWPGGDLALRFQRPDYLKKDHWSVYHVRLRWKAKMLGPLAIGAGRHCGLGVFAALNG
jgi:CRISPR-associated protein Csb2